MRTFSALLLELLVGVAAGLVTSVWLSGEFSFIFGLLVIVLVEVTRLRFQALHVERGVAKIDAFVRGVIGTDPFSELRFLYGLRAGTRLGPDVIRVPKSEVLRFWRDCVARVSSRWIVTTYALAEETWGLGWGTISSNAQRERIDAGCQITRIFVVDSDSEREQLSDTIRQQEELGVRVAWIRKADLLKNREVMTACEALGTLDVALVDDTWIYRTELDKRRHIIGASANRDQQLVAYARFMLTEASAKADWRQYKGW